MRVINYPAAFGTILLFAGFYCMKFVFGAKRETGHERKQPGIIKVGFFLGGILCMLGGIYLILKALKLL